MTSGLVGLFCERELSEQSGRYEKPSKPHIFSILREKIYRTRKKVRDKISIDSGLSTDAMKSKRGGKISKKNGDGLVCARSYQGSPCLHEK
jgi:hypothetical protein